MQPVVQPVVQRVASCIRIFNIDVDITTSALNLVSVFVNIFKDRI